VQLAYVDQSRQTLDDRKTVWQEISGGLDILKVGNYETPSRSLRRALQFPRHAAAAIDRRAVGGERNRVHLAKVIKSGGNVLLLDEPTNDLDVETLRALERLCSASPAAPS
jgi:ATPase subunit of ABC transporter with duplicated ATPase domains